MSSLTAADMRFLVSALGMEAGYCLNFSDRTYAEFFADTLSLDIDAEEFHVEGGSKGKRMRFFLRSQPDDRVARLLSELWDYRADRLRTGLTPDDPAGMETRYKGIVARLQRSTAPLSTDAIDRFAHDQTLDELIAAIQRDIDAGSASTALDRLHTYCMKKLAYLIRQYDPTAQPASTLNARLGQYLGPARRNAKTQHPISFKIMTSAVETFELFNSVRNDRSLAHDNTLIEAAEARFIFDAIGNVLRFIKATEGQAFDGHKRARPFPTEPTRVAFPADLDEGIPF